MSSALRPTPNLEDQILLFTPPGDRVTQIHFQEPASLFVVLYYPQGYDGGIRTLLHTGYIYVYIRCVYNSAFLFTVLATNVYLFDLVMVRLMTLSVVGLNRVDEFDDQLIMSWKSCGRKRSWIYFSWHLVGTCEKARIADLPHEVSTRT
jgi:hypothetical protein